MLEDLPSHIALRPQNTRENPVRSDDETDRPEADARSEGPANCPMLAAGEEELIPSEMVDRMLAGVSPVRVWREHRGLSQSELGRRSGVHRVALVKMEAGQRGGSVDTLKRLADALGVTVDDLI